MSAPSQTEFSLPASLTTAKPKVALVLGSGLGSFIDRVEVAASVPYSEIDGLPVSAVPGHAGTLHHGEIGGVEIVVAQGRVHCYEGWTAREAASLVRLFHQMGVEALLLTNAAGIVNAEFAPGQWMLLSDHINFTGLSPLTGSASFIDQSEIYSQELRQILQATASELGLPPLAEGVYTWMNGPEYETPAEICMLRTLGADAVGMSTVPEAIQARALGLKTVALSCLTNYGAGMSGEPLSHAEVMEVGQQAASQLLELLEQCVPQMV